MKNSFLFYYDWEEAIDTLSNGDAGLIVKALIDHEKGREVNLPTRLVPLFISYRQLLDRNKENYDKKCEKYSNNAKKRWEDKKNEAKLSNGMQWHAVAYDKDKDKDNNTKHTYKEKHMPSLKQNVPLSLTPELKNKLWEELEVASAKEIKRYAKR